MSQFASSSSSEYTCLRFRRAVSHLMCAIAENGEAWGGGDSGRDGIKGWRE